MSAWSIIYYEFSCIGKIIFLMDETVKYFEVRTLALKLLGAYSDLSAIILATNTQSIVRNV